jgi:MFS family permease
MRSPWFVLIIVLLASMAAPLNQFKVPPVMPLLMGAFGASAAQAGLLMSLFAITGLLLAIPAGFIFQKLGYRMTGTIAILSLVIGAGWGALSRGFDIMLATRFIEGVGMSLMSVVAPAVIAMWFSPESRGKAMGVWAVWVPLGSTIMFLLAPALAGGLVVWMRICNFGGFSVFGPSQIQARAGLKTRREGFFRKQAGSRAGEGSFQPRFVADQPPFLLL